MNNVIDCFTYFNEKEILELRINMLYDYVDKFVIVDSNYTHSGIKKKYTLKQTIEELKLPKDKIEVIELDLSSVPPASEYEKIWTPNSKQSSRERLQRDAISLCLNTNNFSDDDVFIVSDCDEIINPKYINFYKNLAKLHRDKIFKVDLVQLEGRADMRAYYTSHPDLPREWWNSLFFCLKSHMITTPLTHIRSEVLCPYEIVHEYENDEIVREHGWHFSWMGNNINRYKKSISFCHHRDELDYLKYGTTYEDEEVKKFLLNYTFREGEISPSGDMNFILKKYPLECLPKNIFELPRVKQFLLPN
jgi:beta-1,4-mannosyl-glycoprotein beta-1,4-N-acetylglucosaminyltransferase